MSKSNDKLSIRLTQILLKLNSGEILSLDDLALEFNVSKRTIQRDINERFSYLPLIKKDGYIRIEEYCLGKLSFKDILDLPLPLKEKSKREPGRQQRQTAGHTARQARRPPCCQMEDGTAGG